MSQADKFSTVEVQKRKIKDMNAELLHKNLLVGHLREEIDQLKAQLNNMEQCYIEKKKQVDAVEHVLGCAMIGPKEVFQYAKRIEKALRGEP